MGRQYHEQTLIQHLPPHAPCLPLSHHVREMWGDSLMEQTLSQLLITPTLTTT